MKEVLNWICKLFSDQEITPNEKHYCAGVWRLDVWRRLGERSTKLDVQAFFRSRN